ncbi:hypothetical protein [Rhizosaccharibacter radicis]|uniref:Lipoprotein n=1 Tax=Rhizosaccharibacter radicis TaxID=2782605 RepID=A0ABT1VU82_9PROT|nr:hypothetical protein [Acetobacteraceae bacterium KSS12]
MADGGGRTGGVRMDVAAGARDDGVPEGCGRGGGTATRGGGWARARRPGGGRAHPARAGRLLVPALAAALLAGCGGGNGGTPGDPGGEWTGILQTDKGVCPDRAPSRLAVDGRKIQFTPADGVLVLSGIRTENSDRLHAQLQLTDMNHHPLPMVFEGKLSADGTHIDGTYGTTACRAHVSLTRPAANTLSHVLGS